MNNLHNFTFMLALESTLPLLFCLISFVMYLISKFTKHPHPMAGTFCILFFGVFLGMVVAAGTGYTVGEIVGG